MRCSGCFRNQALPLVLPIHGYFSPADLFWSWCSQDLAFQLLSDGSAASYFPSTVVCCPRIRSRKYISVNVCRLEAFENWEEPCFLELQSEFICITDDFKIRSGYWHLAFWRRAETAELQLRLLYINGFGACRLRRR